MSLFLLKSLLGSLFLLAGLTAFLSMLTLMGKPNKKMSVSSLKKIHKSAGVVFFLLLLLISYFCLGYWAAAGDQLSVRAIFHAVFSLGLIVVFLIKISIVRIYKQFLRMAPPLGIIVFVLAFLVFCTSAGYFFLQSFCGSQKQVETPSATLNIAQPDPQKGEAIFTSNCAGCHYADKEESKFGPGLSGLMKKDKLPVSGKSATRENVKSQLLKPFRTMPSFTNLSEQETEDLLAYLEKL